MSLPISVIVPHRRDREDFFSRFCLPSIQANLPSQIIVQTNDGHSAGEASRARNDGARKATQPFLFFCDDDLILAGNCLSALYETLKFFDFRPAFAYGDYLGIVLPGSSHPAGGSFKQFGQPWDVDLLMKCNYISTMSLLRNDEFPGFDDTLPQLDDWDLWLTLAERGCTGAYTPEVLFHAYYFGDGITREENQTEARRRILEKHKALAVRRIG